MDCSTREKQSRGSTFGRSGRQPLNSSATWLKNRLSILPISVSFEYSKSLWSIWLNRIYVVPLDVSEEKRTRLTWCFSSILRTFFIVICFSSFKFLVYNVFERVILSMSDYAQSIQFNVLRLLVNEWLDFRRYLRLA